MLNNYAPLHVLLLNISVFMYVHVHGASFSDSYWYGSVLFDSQRVEEVIVGDIKHRAS